MSGVKPISPLDKFRALSVTRAIPLQASLELTYRCNERCTHCYIENFRDDPKKVLSLEDWYKVLHELRSAGTLYLILMGGEAMLNPHFWDIARKASELNFYVSMITNGLKIKNQEVANKLSDVGVQLISFSLYSMNPEIHDRMTSVKGSQERLLSAIDFCDKAGIQPSVNVLLSEANAAGVFEVYDWCVERGYEVKVDPTITPRLNGNLEPTKYRARPETLKWFYRERSRRWAGARPKPSGETEGDYVCNAAKGKCAVNPYGELLPCIEIREPFGSLVEESFADLWHKPEALKWRKIRIKDLNESGGMELYNFCDHCPGMAKHEHGDALRPTDFTKTLAKAKLEVSKEGSL